ncbi:dihydroxyacetone kinase subunit DhaL [Propionibacterium freudenreichii]|nr:dihydroxyacetone kinase subunit L [Propionibacterium freudenreichii]
MGNLMGDERVTKVAAWLHDYADTITEHSQELTDLDREIGDADHGFNMERGVKAIAALDPAQFADPGAYLKKVGMTLVSTVGGAAGPLYGTLFLRMATALPTDTALTTATFAKALRAGLEGVTQRGKSAVGDKTMVDALAPAVERLEADAAAGDKLANALKHASTAAQQGRDATVDLVARRGRASYLGERSKGHLDPGAASLTMLIESAARTLS